MCLISNEIGPGSMFMLVILAFTMVTSHSVIKNFLKNLPALSAVLMLRIAYYL